MKVYQQIWILLLEKAQTTSDVLKVCKEIVADDTGATDQLSQLLAKTILARLTPK